jgi:hypothetical protein
MKLGSGIVTKLLSLPSRRMQSAGIGCFTLIAGLVLLPISVDAGVLSFSVTATAGPAPSVITAGAFYSDQQTLTFQVLPDLAVSSVDGFSAQLDYDLSWSSIFAEPSFSAPIPDTYLGDGYVDNEVNVIGLGYGVLDAGVSGAYAINWEDVEPFGQTSGFLDLIPGIYTVTAIAYWSINAPVSGETIYTTSSYASTTPSFTVVEGDVNVLPEPSTELTTVTATPEPVTYVLMASGLMTLALARKRKGIGSRSTPQ